MHFWKFWNCPSESEINKYQNCEGWFIPQNCPNQTCGYFLITPSQQTLCIETNISEQQTIANQQVGNYIIVGNYKIIGYNQTCD